MREKKKEKKKDRQKETEKTRVGIEILTYILLQTIVNYSRVVPDGLLVFFPSYSVMTQCIEHWQVLIFFL